MRGNFRNIGDDIRGHIRGHIRLGTRISRCGRRTSSGRVSGYRRTPTTDTLSGLVTRLTITPAQARERAITGTMTSFTATVALWHLLSRQFQSLVRTKKVTSLVKSKVTTRFPSQSDERPLYLE